MMAAALENNGATVYIIGRRLSILEETAQRIGVAIITDVLSMFRLTRGLQKYDRVIPLEGDVTDRDSLLSVVDAVKTRHGYIDLLINNAGLVNIFL